MGKCSSRKSSDRKTKTLRCDRRGEYIQNEFSTFCGEHGITHQNSAPYTPTTNCLMKKKKKKKNCRHNKCHNLKCNSFNLWEETLLIVSHIYDRASSKKIKGAEREREREMVKKNK